MLNTPAFTFASLSLRAQQCWLAALRLQSSPLHGSTIMLLLELSHRQIISLSWLRRQHFKATPGNSRTRQATSGHAGILRVTRLYAKVVGVQC